jgi:hypothetical protein
MQFSALTPYREVVAGSGSFSEAFELFESSRLAPAALGQQVFEHLRTFY